MEKFELSNLIEELNTLILKLLRDYESQNLSKKISKLKLKSGSVIQNYSKGLLHNLPDNRTFKIGDVNIRNPMISAPLAGISDNTYRIFASSFGSGLTFTEMITSYGICYRHRKSLSMTNITDNERPCTLQIFGADPDVIAEAARQVEDKADIVDINMGCPVAKVLKSGCGGYLVRDEDKIKKILNKLSAVLKKPFTVKTRIGWDSSNINILRILKIAEDSGASAISIHGRTVKQRFTGKVDYKIIKKVKEKAEIPVIVSGDIDSPKKAKEIFEYTECDGIMIGRAAKGRLWIFTDLILFFLGYCRKPDDVVFDPDIKWKKEFSKLYLKFLIYFKGEDKAVREFRKHLSWIFKGTRGINKARCEFFKIESFNNAENSIDNI